MMDHRHAENKLITERIVSELDRVFQKSQLQQPSLAMSVRRKQRSLSNLNFEIQAAMDAVQFVTIGSLNLSSLQLKENNNTALQFLVTDLSLGIDCDQFSTIATAFGQSAHSDGSDGVAERILVLNQQLIESKGGYIRVKSQQEQGSVFSFTLNFPKTDVLSNSSTALEHTLLEQVEKNRKIEPDRASYLFDLLMRKLVTDFGFEPELPAYSMVEVEKLQTADYDIVLLDLQLPLMNGFEAMRYLCGSLNYRVPVYAISAEVSVEEPFDFCDYQSVYSNSFANGEELSMDRNHRNREWRFLISSFYE